MFFLMFSYVCMFACLRAVETRDMDREEHCRVDASARLRELEEEEEEENAKRGRRNLPPENIPAWCDKRLKQGTEMIERFHEQGLGDLQMCQRAINILEHWYGICITNLGDMKRVNAELGRCYSDNTPITYQPGEKDIFDGMYAHLGSAASTASFAMQQAFFESQGYYGWKAPAESREQWQIRNLHRCLLNENGQSFSTYDNVSDASQLSHTLVGNSSNLKGIEKMVNRDSMGEKTHSLEVHSLGPDKELRKKAEVFKFIFQLSAGQTAEERPFCPGIVALSAPDELIFVDSNSAQQNTLAKLSGSWAERIKATQRSLQPIPSNSNSSTTPPPSKRKVENNVVVLVSKQVRQQQERERKEREKANQARLDAATKQAKSCGSLRFIESTNTSNEAIENYIVSKAQKCRANRDTNEKWGNAVAATAIANAITLFKYEERVQPAKEKYEELEAKKREILDAKERIRDECTYKLEDESDDELGGTWNEEEYAKLSEEDRFLYESKDDDEKNKDMLESLFGEEELEQRRQRRLEIETRCMHPFKEKKSGEWGEWNQEAFDALPQESKDLYHAQVPSIDPSIIRAANEPSPMLVFAKLPNMTLNAQKILKRAPKPPDATDYFEAFEFQNDSDGKRVLDHAIAVLHGRIPDARLEPWQHWLKHLIYGENSRMRRDRIEYQAKLRAVIQRLRCPPQPPLKGVKNGHVYDQAAYERSVEKRKAWSRARQREKDRKKRVEQRRKDQEDKKRAREEEEAQKKQAKAQKREDAEKAKEAEKRIRETKQSERRESKRIAEEEKNNKRQRTQTDRALKKSDTQLANILKRKRPAKNQDEVFMEPVIDESTGFAIPGKWKVKNLYKKDDSWVDDIVFDDDGNVIPGKSRPVKKYKSEPYVPVRFETTPEDGSKPRKIPINFKIRGFTRRMTHTEYRLLPEIDKRLNSTYVDYAFKKVADYEAPVYRPLRMRDGTVRYLQVDWPVLKAGSEEEQRERKRNDERAYLWNKELCRRKNQANMTPTVAESPTSEMINLPDDRPASVA